MAPPKIRELSVLKKSYVTDNMLRITLGGDNIETLPPNQEGGYVKLIFPQDNGRLMRTYTIRNQSQSEIDIDFVVHGNEEGHSSGPACSWALNCQAGDVIQVGGPGPKKLLNPDADWILMAGDMTALPAMSVNLENVDDNIKGYVVIEVLSEQDIQPLKAPDNVEIHWLVNQHPGTKSDLLVEKIKTLPWLEGKVSVWAASEFGAMKQLRQFFKQEKQVDRKDMYVSSYWKNGISEDEHKIVKSEDASKEA